ncbi:hypothetical protein PANT_1d00044 [Moesziomyces antarcticus T-34]|uniref:Zn(2)-C6 fungal-type domain-containing protein n=1 Tax=Pseudozyma antarctica (strain T-34) TaxID=1151754 RepID=M9LSL6_PSEA3|nr:hypothetical protein PANT_1d00044 [Moesziomyces antarcticus T-34]
MTRAIDAAGMSDSAPSSSSDEADIHTLANIATARWQHHHAHRRSPASQPRTVVQRSTDDQGAPDVDASSSSAAAAAAARSSAPSRHDRRASKACQACRARKTRCDAQQPKCSYCRKHDIDCHYVAGDLRKQRPSKRRRSSPQPDHARDDSDPPPPPSPPAHRLPPRERVEHVDHTEQQSRAAVRNDWSHHSHAHLPHASSAASYAPSMDAPYAASSHPASSTRDAHSVASSHSSTWPAIPAASVVTSVPDAAAHDVQFLPNELIEALSGKVAWFDELERQSATSTTDATRLHDTTTAHNIWSTASDVAAFDPMLADLLHQTAPSGNAAPAGKDRIIQLHYFRSFSGATAVTQGLKKISVRIRVPAELESMLIEAQNRTNLFDPAASGLDPQTLNLHSLLGTSRFMPSPNPAAASTSAAHRTAFPAMHEAHTPSALSSAAYAEDLPDAPLRDLLIARFFLRLADHFPFLSRSTLEAQLARGSQVNPALINAMCALAARFVEPYETTMLSPAAGTGGSVNASNDPDATADSVFGSAKPHSRGLRFAERAKSYMMSSITLPSVTTVATLVLLAWHEFGVNSDSGLWMFAGMAIRMSIDLGLHRRAKNNWFAAAPRADAGDLIQPQPLFWCVFILDRTLSIGTGRPTSLKDQEITLDYPRTVLPIHRARKETNDRASEATSSSRSSSDTRPSVFGHLTRLMQKAGALAEIANNLGEDDDPQPLEELDKLEADMIGDYDALPASLMLGEDQLRTSSEPRCLLSLHLWFHLLLMLMNRLPLSRLRAKPVASDESREILRHGSQQIRNAVLYANAVDPMIHLGCPFTNQAFCLAGGSLFVQSHLEAYQRCVDALDKLTETWLGVTWIANALKARKTEETHDAAPTGNASAGGSAAGETMLSLSELKVLLRLAASTVSSTEQPMSILEDSSNPASGTTSGSSNSAPSWTSPPTQPGKPTVSAGVAAHHPLRAPPSRPASTALVAPGYPSTSHAASFEHSVGATSMPQHGALVEISDISHPDDLSHFLPFLSRPLP